MNPQINPDKLKIFLRMVVFAAVILGVVIAVIFNIASKQNEKLLKEGLRQNVIVLHKYKSGTRKNPSFHMEVAWFTEGEQVDVYKSKDTAGLSQDEKFSNEVLSEVFKDVKRTKLGDYNAFKMKYVDGNIYNNLEVGDKAILVYRDGEPADGLLILKD